MNGAVRFLEKIHVKYTHLIFLKFFNLWWCWRFGAVGRCWDVRAPICVPRGVPWGLSPGRTGVWGSSPEEIFKNRCLKTPFPAISGSNKKEMNYANEIFLKNCWSPWKKWGGHAPPAPQFRRPCTELQIFPTLKVIAISRLLAFRLHFLSSVFSLLPSFAQKKGDEKTVN